jgi:hypothetical protein
MATRERWRWDKQRQELYQVGHQDDAPPAKVFYSQSFDAYVSPITGETVRGARHRAQEMNENRCIDARDGYSAEQRAQIFERKHEQAIQETMNEVEREYGRG